MDFGELELVTQHDTIICGKEPLRVYRTKTLNKQDKFESYRYHFGFPEKVVKPLCPLLETSPYWGEQHWKEIDGFWVWWLMITTNNDEMPYAELNRDLDWKIKSANKVIQLFRRWADESKPR